MTESGRRVLVTGAAGFIGSHLCERLLDEGCEVLGVDGFTPYYARPLKEANLAGLRERDRFTFRELDLRTADPAELVLDRSWVFHQAAQAGVRASWGRDFQDYLGHNLLSTQRLLEACRAAGTERFVFASSSSVYGDLRLERTPEDAPLRPISPYGVTKVAGERLVDVYHREFGLDAVMLRYFTVCGPRQRPDMAFHKILRALHTGTAFPLLGDGSQERDFTFCADAVEANLLAARRGRPGGIYNIGGGRPTVLRDAIRVLESVTGRTLAIDHRPRGDGDPHRTAADLTRAREDLGYEPKVPVEEALEREAAWFAGPRGPLALEAGETA